MFDQETVRDIEEAEVGLTRAVVEAALASGDAPRAFLRQLGSAVAAYLRPHSPMNKLIGAGLSASIAETELENVESSMRACGERTRIELSTLASRAVESWLLGRGYRVIGFENVLVRSLHRNSDAIPTNVAIERVTRETAALWTQITIEASAQSDETGDVVDQFSKETIATAVEDFLRAPGFDRYLARRNGIAVAAASMRIQGRTALLCGSATLAPYRLRGAQTALIAARLADARQRGAELAVVTTAPDSRSESNLLARGFSVAYARTILERD
jgi:hypothetical protein